jgi:hypothetical protein
VGLGGNVFSATLAGQKPSHLHSTTGIPGGPFLTFSRAMMYNPSGLSIAGNADFLHHFRTVCAAAIDWMALNHTDKGDLWK